MIKFAFEKLKTKKYIIQGIIFFTIFFFLYLVLDYLNVREMTKTPSTIWLVSNILLNVVMGLSSALLMNLSTIMVELKAGSDRGGNFGFFSVLFGVFTYGCTSCVVAFFTAIGISFSPTIFPFIHVLDGMLYKFLSLLLVGVGLFIVIWNIEKGKCKVKLDKK